MSWCRACSPPRARCELSKCSQALHSCTPTVLVPQRALPSTRRHATSPLRPHPCTSLSLSRSLSLLPKGFDDVRSSLVEIDAAAAKVARHRKGCGHGHEKGGSLRGHIVRPISILGGGQTLVPSMGVELNSSSGRSAGEVRIPPLHVDARGCDAAMFGRSVAHGGGGV